MAKKTQPDSETIVENSVVTVENLIGQFATQVEFGVGCHLMGQTLTLSASRGSTLQLAQMGVLATAVSTGRVVLLPWANLKAVEIQPAKFSRRTGRAIQTLK